jgi:uncharacterized protein
VVAAIAGPGAVPALYDAEVVHSRRDLILRTFRHRISLWLVDLDALPVLPPWLRAFGRFEAADHLGVPERSIRHNLDAWLATEGVDLQGGQVLMLANARSLGYVFNPITLYWCSLPDGRPECVVAEVHNTYGERHCYLLRPNPEGWAETAKDFYVSPFIAVHGEYEMRVSRPGRDLAVAVSLRQHGEIVFAVELHGTRHALTRRRLVATLLRHPFGSYRISTLIRLHGIRLWLGRIPVQPRTPHVAKKGIQ